MLNKIICAFKIFLVFPSGFGQNLHNFLIILSPFRDNSFSLIELGFESFWIVAEIDSFSCGFGGLRAPSVAPQPFLREWKYWNVLLEIIW